VPVSTSQRAECVRELSVCEAVCVYCSVLQCVAVCCSVLQWAAVGCSELESPSVYLRGSMSES